MKRPLLFIIINSFAFLSMAQNIDRSKIVVPDSIESFVLRIFDGREPCNDTLKLQLAMRYGSFSDSSREICFNFSDGERGCIDFDIDSLYQEILRLQKDNYLIHRMYGDFLLELFEEKRFSLKENSIDIAQKMYHHYFTAWLHGVFDARSLYGMGYYCSLDQKFEQSSEWYIRSLELDSLNGLTNYGLGVTLLLDKNSAEAQTYAIRAVELLTDSLQKSDAARMAGIALYNNESYERAYSYFAMADSLSPHFSLNQLFLLRSSLQLQKVAESEDIAGKIFSDSPHSPDIADRIFELYRIRKETTAYLKHIRSMKKKYSHDDEALGNLKFHEAKILFLSGKKSKAQRVLKQARNRFSRVLPPNHQAFEAVEDMMKGFEK